MRRTMRANGSDTYITTNRSEGLEGAIIHGGSHLIMELSPAGAL